MAVKEKPPAADSYESFEEHGYSKEDIVYVELAPVEGQDDLDIPGVLVVHRKIVLDDESMESVAHEMGSVSIPEKTLTLDEEAALNKGLVRYCTYEQAGDEYHPSTFYRSLDRIDHIFRKETVIAHKGWHVFE